MLVEEDTLIEAGAGDGAGAFTDFGDTTPPYANFKTPALGNFDTTAVFLDIAIDSDAELHIGVDGAGTADDAMLHLQDRVRVYLGGATIGNGLDTEFGADAVDFAAGDVDGDGVLDVVACTSEGGGELLVLIGDGSGQFTANEPLPQPGCAQVAVADFNGDGLGDVAVADAAEGISLRIFDP